MHTFQTKTIEQLIVILLHDPKNGNEKVHFAFEQMLRHFSDEGYLYGIDHGEIIKEIYIKNFYKFRYAEALPMEMALDNKTLLTYRKSYLRLFAKYYLNLSVFIEEDFIRLYESLREEVAANMGK